MVHICCKSVAVACPGPNQYTIPDVLGRSVESSKQRAPAYTIYGRHPPGSSYIAHQVCTRYIVMTPFKITLSMGLLPAEYNYTARCVVHIYGVHLKHHKELIISSNSRKCPCSFVCGMLASGLSQKTQHRQPADWSPYRLLYTMKRPAPMLLIESVGAFFRTTVDDKDANYLQYYLIYSRKRQFWKLGTSASIVEWLFCRWCRRRCRRNWRCTVVNVHWRTTTLPLKVCRRHRSARRQWRRITTHRKTG